MTESAGEGSSEPPAAESVWVSAADVSPRVPARDVARPLGADEGADAAGADDDVSVSDPVEPPEPVRSANAAGMENTAEPTPRAMASVPILPT